MPVSLFNTATRAAEPFRPLDPAGRLVKMYTCGPTVYNYAHIGNFRAYIFEDLLQRHLEARGVQFLWNTEVVGWEEGKSQEPRAKNQESRNKSQEFRLFPRSKKQEPRD